MQLQTPDGAAWFGIEVKTGEDSWQRIDEKQIGGKWFRVGTVTPEDIAKQLAALVTGAIVCRVLWAPKDRRSTKLGTSPPFEVSPDEPSEPTPPPPPPAQPQQPERARPRPQQQAPVAPAAPPLSPYAPPMVPMPFAPPPPSATDPLSTFVYIHSLVHQDKLAHQQQTLSMAQLMIEGERARSRESIKSMEMHFATIDKARAELHRALSENDRSGPQLQQLAEAVGALGAKVEELALEEEPHELAVVPPDATDAQKAMAAVGSVLNSPAGQVIAKVLQNQFAGNDATAPAAQPEYEDVPPLPEQ